MNRNVYLALCHSWTNSFYGSLCSKHCALCFTLQHIFLTFSFFLNCKWNRAINYFCHIRFSLRQLARKVNHRMKVLLCLTLGNLSKSVYFLPDWQKQTNISAFCQKVLNIHSWIRDYATALQLYRKTIRRDRTPSVWNGIYREGGYAI